MLTPESTSAELTRDYTTAVDALWQIARTDFFLGKLDAASRLLSTALQLFDKTEVQPHQYLKLLLLYGQILSVDLLLTRGSAAKPFAVAHQARQLAEETRDQQDSADALGLLGEVHYFTTLVTLLRSGASPNSPRSEGKYVDALTYQQQALELREKLHDTRGISESCFQIGVVYERWQEFDQAQAYYARARQVADHYGHAFEKTEPARHVALEALRKGELPQALSLALQAVELREVTGFLPYLPLDHLLVRSVYLALGDTKQAQFHLEKATELAHAQGRPELVASLPDIRSVLQTSSSHEE